MNLRQDIQRVDIETYFSDVDDHVKDSDQAVIIPPANLVSTSVKQQLITTPATSGSVLKPYQNERSLLFKHRDFSVFELEAAHGAVRELRDKLQENTSPKVKPLPLPKVEISEPPKPNWIRPAAGLLVILMATAITSKASWPYISACLAQQCYYSTQERFIEIAKSLSQVASDRLSNNSQADDSALDQQHFSTGLRYAQAASDLTQQAQTSTDWQQVVQLWQLALNSIGHISSESTLYSEAQAKEVIYRTNLAYSRRELDMAPFRGGVKAAEEASRLAIEANSKEDWQTVADKWQAALTKMQAVSSNNQHYSIAQAKLVEYSTKFAYAQKRYLDSQATYRP
ncbi:hypothetical protein C7293_00810 [filamentous cyanobacterium CCT1]|nr:hypothetical protein C7293_00810 [filamentous cyanobacterium CCT1]PSN80962.1 hypothetical protein C8B47_03855 [filamentous cyanobacterium CCP4]